ncbi:unnamed protein product, partial [Protopolystoma xenopodis]
MNSFSYFSFLRRRDRPPSAASASPPSPPPSIPSILASEPGPLPLAPALLGLGLDDCFADAFDPVIGNQCDSTTATGAPYLLSYDQITNIGLVDSLMPHSLYQHHHNYSHTCQPQLQPQQQLAATASQPTTESAMFVANSNCLMLQVPGHQPSTPALFSHPQGQNLHLKDQSSRSSFISVPSVTGENLPLGRCHFPSSHCVISRPILPCTATASAIVNKNDGGCCRTCTGVCCSSEREAIAPCCKPFNQAELHLNVPSGGNPISSGHH